MAGLNLTELLKGAGAVIVSPMLEKQILPMLPASVSGTTYGRWAVKLGAALGTWYVSKAAFGRRSADVVAIALGSHLIADAVVEFFPTFKLSAYAQPQMGAYSRRGLGLVMPGQMASGGLRAVGPMLRGIGPAGNVRVGASPMSDNLFNPPF